MRKTDGTQRVPGLLKELAYAACPVCRGKFTSRNIKDHRTEKDDTVLCPHCGSVLKQDEATKKRGIILLTSGALIAGWSLYEKITVSFGDRSWLPAVLGAVWLIYAVYCVRRGKYKVVSRITGR